MTNEELHKIMVEAATLLDKAHEEYKARKSEHADKLWECIVTLEELPYPHGESRRHTWSMLPSAHPFMAPWRCLACGLEISAYDGVKPHSDLPCKKSE